MAGWTWRERTWPFSAVGAPHERARFVIEQVDDAEFVVPEGFGFQLNREGREPIVVDAGTLPSTDLTSVPPFVAWFVTRHGRHTPAVLVHDRLVDDSSSATERAEADDLFLRNLEQLDVPQVRRSVMWAAVVVGSRWKSGGPARAGIVAWGATAAAGMALFGAGVVRRRPWWGVASLLLPVPASLLWGRRVGAGLIAGYALPPVVVPAATAAGGWSVYWVAEQVARRLTATAPTTEVEDLPPPVAFGER
jgi:hypothetical protein